MNTPSYREDRISQEPALKLLTRLGYTYLSPEQAEEMRGGRKSAVLLEGVLRERLRAINDITRRGETYDFSEANIENAVLEQRHPPLQDGFIAANAHLYDLLTLGKSFEQRIEGDKKSHTLYYIDWDNIENNAFHVTEEYPVTRTARADTYRPDIVLFVNGIPLVVIECKSSGLSGTTPPVDLGVEQHLRNCKKDGIRDLYVYTSLLLSVATNAAKYGTTGTSKEYWSVWKERFSSREAELAYRAELRGLITDSRPITAQDELLHALCRPERLLDITRNYTLYDDGTKKIARYQQYFAVADAMERVRTIGADGKRRGGVIWHTQGSGKSLTMVMLAQLLANARWSEGTAPAYPPTTGGSSAAKIILVTDRIDLDDQIAGTFKKCKQEVVQARTGSHLTELLEGTGDEIITTIINKFEAAVRQIKEPFDNPNIFVLIDEGHRTQYGSFNVSMERVFPRACFIAFTGTPLMKSEKHTATKFGGYIGLPYTVNDAVEDGAVVPLLYEGRHNHITLNEDPINRYFDRVSEPLSDYGKAELKRKFSTVEHLNRADQVVYARAWDISQHYRDFFQTNNDTYKPKAQLVAPRVKTALLYHKYLKEIGYVSSAVVVSPSDTREGTEDSFYNEDEEREYEEKYFAAMYDKYGDQRKYEESIISQFKKRDHPEILIVVAKLLTGFDAPANTILYLCRSLKEHTLLQAVARVNRVYPGKDYGYIIDYYGNLENLDNALETYSALGEYDAEDIAGALTNIQEEIAKLPQAHAELWDLFKTLPKGADATVYGEFLEPKDHRDKFYEKLSAFAKLLKLALSSVDFAEHTPSDRIDRYKRDLRFFLQLRVDVKRRYNDELSYREFEPQIQKLIDKHITTVGETLKVTELVNIFDREEREAAVAEIGSDAAKADHIASRTAKAINVKMAEDPIYFKRLSDLIKETIAAYHQKRIDEAEYLKRAKDLEDKFFTGRSDDAPEALRGNEAALAFYDFSREIFADTDLLKTQFHIEVAQAIDRVVSDTIYLNGKKMVDWHKNSDITSKIRLQLGDEVYDLLNKYDAEVDWDSLKVLEDESLKVALVKYA